MTLLEALSAKQDAEVAQGKAVSLSDLNNGMKVLNKNKEYSLPKVELRSLMRLQSHYLKKVS